jgi:ABC-type glycerol-3-phosphate transport system substrate-binding protein
MRNATATLLALLLAGAAVGCSSSGDSKADAKPLATITVTKSAAPSLSRDEIMQQCTDAVAEAAPGWDDWNFDPGAWADDPRTPKVCLGLKDDADPTQGNRDYARALIDGLNAADDPRASQ